MQGGYYEYSEGKYIWTVTVGEKGQIVPNRPEKSSILNRETIWLFLRMNKGMI